MKIVTAFPEVDLYWLLNGKGSFPKTTTISPALPAPVLPDPVSSDLFSQTEVSPPKNITTAPVTPKQQIETESGIEKSIDKIVIFYSDGSFRAYHP